MATQLWESAYERVLGHFDTPTTYRLLDRSLHALMRVGRCGAHLGIGNQTANVLRAVAYQDSGLAAHTLDIYIPRRPHKRASARGLLPAVIYFHGGAFAAFSKDTHWLIGMMLAAQGYLVFNVNYRLAPAHPFPAALADSCAAFGWVVKHLARYGGDPARLVLAGESAGANLATALAVCTAYQRREPFARAVFDLDVRPAAVMPACGLLQVSRCERLLLPGQRAGWAVGLIEMVSMYLPSGPDPAGCELADPLVVLEQNVPPQRPLPPFFVPVGLRDPLLEDSRRLETALLRLGVPCVARYYEGEIHAFHTLLWRRRSRRCWADMYAFLETHL